MRAQYLISSQHHQLDDMDAEFARRLGCRPSDGRLRLLRYSLVNAVMVATAEWKGEGAAGDLRARVRRYLLLFEPMIEAIRQQET